MTATAAKIMYIFIHSAGFYNNKNNNNNKSVAATKEQQWVKIRIRTDLIFLLYSYFSLLTRCLASLFISLSCALSFSLALACELAPCSTSISRMFWPQMVMTETATRVH